MGGVVFPSENTAEIGVVEEAYAVHVVALAFAPFGPGPNVGDGVDFEGGIGFNAGSIEGGVEPGFYGETTVVAMAEELVDDGKTGGLGNGVVEIVCPGNIAEEIVIALGIIAKETHDFVELVPGDDHSGAVSECSGLEGDIRECVFEGGQSGMVEGGLGHGEGVFGVVRVGGCFI